MYSTIKTYLRSKYVSFKQSNGLETIIVTPEEVKANAIPCYGVFKEPQGVFNENNQLISASFVYEPVLNAGNEKMLEEGYKFLYMEGEYFTLEGKYIRNLKCYLETGKDETDFNRIMRYNWHRILKLGKVILIVAAFYAAYKLGGG